MKSKKTRLGMILENRPKRLILGLCLLLAVGIIAVHVRTAGMFVEGNIRDNPKAPDDANAHSAPALIEVRNENLDRAIELYKEKLDKNPNDAEAHYNLAVALARMGRIDEAIIQLVNTIKLAPQNSLAHGALANLLLQKNEIELAIQEYENALNIDPNNEDAQAGLEKALIAQSGGSQPKQ
jgi:tetratricopeptide (TPR) repeat protein